MGVTAASSESEKKTLGAIDLFLLENTHPETGCFIYSSMICFSVILTLSRQAYSNAHDITNLGPDGPLVSRQTRPTEPDSED